MAPAPRIAASASSSRVESSPARAERGAQRHLAFPLAGSREKQAGDVRAGDEQHDARCREQQLQRRGRHFGQHRITLTTRQHRKPAGSRTDSASSAGRLPAGSESSAAFAKVDSGRTRPTASTSLPSAASADRRLRTDRGPAESGAAPRSGPPGRPACPETARR